MDLVMLRTHTSSYMTDAPKRINAGISHYKMSYAVTNRMRIPNAVAVILIKADKFAIAPIKEELQVAMLAKNSAALMDFDVLVFSHADRGTKEDNIHIAMNTMCLMAPADKVDLISAQCADLDLTALGLLTPTIQKMAIVPVRNLDPAERSDGNTAGEQSE